MVSNQLAAQRALTALALSVVGPADFVLAGSGAIREHGIIDRPTEDIDLFTVQASQNEFLPAVDLLLVTLREARYTVHVIQRQAGFARLAILSPEGIRIDMDLGIDWRAERPVKLSVGPVLARDDAVGNKVATLFSRGEIRDLLDVDAIRRSGLYSDDELYRLARRADAGFDLRYLRDRLRSAATLELSQVSDYDVGSTELAMIKARLAEWASHI